MELWVIEILGPQFYLTGTAEQMSTPATNVTSGIWVGIDLGTSNSSCAVWDSTRGRPKWLRLVDVALPEHGSKWGRIVPTVLKVSRQKSIDVPHVGASALKIPSGTLLTSVKRLLGKKLLDLNGEFIASLPFEVVEDNEGELLLAFQVADTNEVIKLSPVQLLGMVLGRIRQSAQIYIEKYGESKSLEVPGGPFPEVRNAVIGVPAHFSKRQISLVIQAGRLAGLDGSVTTCVESNAAAMAYGLTLQDPSTERNIMVIDMGGGTTDITIASNQKESVTITDGMQGGSENISAYQVIVTKGGEQLGGDDIDRAMMEYCLRNAPHQNNSLLLTRTESSQLLRACRRAKENLCNMERPSESERVYFEYGKGSTLRVMKVEIDQTCFQEIMEPWLHKARDLIQSAVDQFVEVSDREISEVVLVGGTTRIPAIRQMIQNDFFPELELSVSQNPMSSVAQGLAIQSAILSNLVPLHQLRSALMLDCLPHAIGILHDPKDEGSFVEILKRNTPLPAQAAATFSLASKGQPGVSFYVVEKVGISQEGNPIFEPMAKEPFTFMLHRLSPDELQDLPNRSVQVGMKVTKDGHFIASIFDERDPEQVQRKKLHEMGNIPGEAGAGISYFVNLLLSGSGFTAEQVTLFGILIGLLVLYVALKISFVEA